MTTSVRNRVSVIAIVVAMGLALSSAACGADTPKGASSIKQLPSDALTGTYLGLTVHREDVASKLVDQGGNAYIAAVGLFSLREGERLEATVQVSKLSKAARPKDQRFRQQVASQIGGTKVQAFVMGGHDVYRSSQRKQSLTSWFDGDYFMILAVRDTYPTPRALLRELLTKAKVS